MERNYITLLLRHFLSPAGLAHLFLKTKNTKKGSFLATDEGPFTPKGKINKTASLPISLITGTGEVSVNQ